MSNEPGGENVGTPPGYVPAPGGYGYVPEDYSWSTPPPPPPPQARSRGQSPSPAPSPAPPEPPALAPWGDRVLAGLIDFFGPYFIAVFLDLTGHRFLGLIVTLIAVFWGLYNGYQQGATGQSAGKRMIRLTTVRRDDGKVVGGGPGFGRAFLHILDILPCCLGFLWPLWDRRRQTFSDKIMNTLVIKQ